MVPKKIKVNFFFRKPRTGFNFSIESIFEDVKNRLADKIEINTYTSRCFNDGYWSKIVNILQAATRQRKDVNHITGELHFLNLLMRKSRVVLTIHDCGMMNRKSGLAKKIVKWIYLSGPLKKAAIITANSDFTKNQIVDFTGINPDRIRVIPVPVNTIYQPKPKKFNTEKPTILQIGTGYNKNLPLLIAALKGISCHMSIIGKLNEEQQAALVANKIDYTNEVNLTEKEILEKYHQCDILAFVSTYEGFGMPIIEANAIERVVITSDKSSMPEVAGDAAYLVNPLNVNDIRAGILEVINNESLRDNLIRNGKANCKRFNADKIANMYLNCYNEIYAANN